MRETAIELSDIDLHALALLQQLMVEHHVSKLAENLELTQPATSNTLAKMRHTFGDDYFVRTPAGMLPTPIAEQLAEPGAQALAQIPSGLHQRARFDPASAQRSMTIGMTGIGEIVFLPNLVDRLRREAPGVVPSTVRNSAVNLRDDVAASKVDLAIGLPPLLKGGLFQRRKVRQRYVRPFRRGHRIGKKKLTLTGLRAAEHWLVVSAGTGHGKVDERLQRTGIDRVIRLTVPQFLGLGHILQGTDMVATVPERLAERLSAPFGLSYLPHPVKLPEVAINVFWHAKMHQSPAHQWLRDVVFDLFADDRAAAHPGCPSLGGELPLRDLALGDREVVCEAVDALAVPELLGIGDFEFLLQAKVAAHQLIECHRPGLLNTDYAHGLVGAVSREPGGSDRGTAKMPTSCGWQRRHVAQWLCTTPLTGALGAAHHHFGACASRCWASSTLRSCSV